MGELTQKELYLEEYKIMGGILLQDEALFWRRCELFLLINGGLLTILGLLHSKDVTSNLSLNLAPMLFSLIGALLCVLWYFILKRSEAIYDHWYEHLKYLEKTQLQPMDVYTIADEYFTNGKIQFGDDKFKLDSKARRIRISQALEVTSLIFASIWVGLAIYFILT